MNFASVLTRSVDQSALRDTTKLASDFKITPSRGTLSWLAFRVEPDEVISTINSAAPDAGAASVAPIDSTMRYSAMPC